jgi:hypothetical protein
MRTRCWLGTYITRSVAQVLDRQQHPLGVVLEHPEPAATSTDQHAADASGGVVVVERTRGQRHEPTLALGTEGWCGVSRA